MGGVLILGGVTTAILTTTLPSYQVTKVLITNAPEALTGEVKQSGASSNPIEFIIEGKSKNGGKAPSPSFSITMTGTDDSNPPK
jgi:hypothetical protein